ncbi:hypothetical protein [Flavihumibacter fluvii]|uniref:hypothetical protein n=1 Tax=Flavihumibacter fluvii TaxID=2838157 RepID=UPI001BDE3563|nr:hypothetical protein [Flavihumibacter fluvii]ULQ53954.1 hypothetical protein KJS93_06435 [Flavihumibacter fluvii]
MKKSGLLLLSAFFLLLLPEIKAQGKQEPESLGLPGDNLNLYAVLKIFQESETLEAFEKKLNDKEANINNLDLDGDDNIDYIMVTDEVDGDVHNIILKVAVNGSETQDVAVFTVERDKDNQVQIQVTGDEELYGKDYIIEPNFISNDKGLPGNTPNPGYTGKTVTFEGEPVAINLTTTVVIASWPIVRYVYAPSYVYWHSPWHWGFYPPWWRPWRPFYWHQYYGYHYNWYHYYYGHYRRYPYHRYNRWNDYYYHGRRSRSITVYNRYQNGLYKQTYSHPETRKEGVALYNKKHPDNPGRPSRPAPKPTPTNPAVTRPIRPAPTPGNKLPPNNNKPVTRPTQPVQPKPAPKPIVKPAPRPTPKPAPKPTIKQ